MKIIYIPFELEHPTVQLQYHMVLIYPRTTVLVLLCFHNYEDKKYTVQGRNAMRSSYVNINGSTK